MQPLLDSSLYIKRRLRTLQPCRGVSTIGSKGTIYFLNSFANWQIKVKFDCVLALESNVACLEDIGWTFQTMVFVVARACTCNCFSLKYIRRFAKSVSRGRLFKLFLYCWLVDRHLPYYIERWHESKTQIFRGYFLVGMKWIYFWSNWGLAFFRCNFEKTERVSS